MEQHQRKHQRWLATNETIQHMSTQKIVTFPIPGTPLTKCTPSHRSTSFISKKNSRPSQQKKVEARCPVLAKRRPKIPQRPLKTLRKLTKKICYSERKNYNATLYRIVSYGHSTSLVLFKYTILPTKSQPSPRTNTKLTQLPLLCYITCFSFPDSPPDNLGDHGNLCGCEKLQVALSL